jgi:hypothetical protein
MTVRSEPSEQDVLMTIQNSKRPEQLIYVVRDKAGGGFRTAGLKEFFGVKEIRIDLQEMIQSVPEYGEVLSFLLQTMSAAQELNLPFAYENEFNFRDNHFTLYADGDYRVLHRAG